jgi:hypothetical protein
MTALIPWLLITAFLAGVASLLRRSIRHRREMRQRVKEYGA